MKSILALVILSLASSVSGIAQQEERIVKKFIKNYNEKDSLAFFNLMHEDFQEYFESFVAIRSKKGYAENYAWGKIMNDRLEYEIINIKEGSVEIMSTYFSDRDKLLKIPPFKSIRTYYVSDEKVIKIVEIEFEGYQEYNDPRNQKFEAFFEWVTQKYHISAMSIKFDKEGAIKLKKLIKEYSASD